ncbi:MAG: kelch repeat-containing protein [Geothrix sp.]|nr:kelch repeat-containing protein [Geothrix sp.]
MFLGLALLGLSCKEVVEAPSALAYPANPAVYIVGIAIPANSPTHSGGAIASYAVSPALPAGLGLDPASGVISGIPTTVTAAASYTVTGTNSTGSTTATLSLTVNAPAITITAQPANQSILVGQTATFKVIAAGLGTLSYQWLQDGLTIPGALAADYTTPTAALADSGTAFSVQVSDAFGGSVTSASATLIVLSTAGPGLFTATGSLAAARASHTATLLPSGKVLIAGGFNGTPLGTAELYDPVAGTFSPTGSLATPREFHSATLLPSGQVLIAGGTSYSTVLASAEIYDPATGSFTATGSLLAARSDHSATLLPDGQVLFVAGRTLSTYLASAELYDPATGVFTATAHAPLTARAVHTATLLGDGQILIAGGFETTALATAERYDPATETFTATGTMAVPRSYHSATVLPDGRVLVVGGAATTSVELYDPATGTFAATGNLLDIRVRLHAATLLPTGMVLVAGGIGSGSPALLLSSAELYDPATGLFTATGSMTTGRQAHTATVLQDGKALITGGAGAGFLSSAEIYD